MTKNNDPRFMLHRINNTDLDALTDAVTELVDMLQRIDKYAPGAIPKGLTNALISMEAECCIELTDRGMLETADDDSNEFTPVQPPLPPDPTRLKPFQSFIDGIDFDSPSPWGEGDTGGEGS